MSDLLKLAERCEAAEGPNGDLDLDIHGACNASKVWTAEERTWMHLHGEFAPYTASLDAALTLVPEGWRLAALCEREPWFCRLETLDFRSVTWGKGEDWITDITDGQEAMAKGSSPALALCAAALRARAPIERKG